MSSGPVQDGRGPARHEYSITDKGTQVLFSSLRQILSEPAEEYPLFPAGLSFAAFLSPGEVAMLLRRRREILSSQLHTTRQAEAAVSEFLPAIFLIESDYAQVIAEAEIAWLDSTIALLDRGELSWDTEQLLRAARSGHQEHH